MADELAAGELSLRALDVSDAPELHLIFSDPATHTIGEGPKSSIADTRQWLRRRDERRREYGVTWYGVRDDDGTLIGNAGLFIGRTGVEPEIGFEIRAVDQGKGYGTRAAAAVVAEAHRAGWTRIWATVRPTNAAPLQALTRAGFVSDRTEDEGRGSLVYLYHRQN
ncbi:GNAT family N-acetyltransferase [Microbacterium gorillae]|uniref:GNAT family N-acetyltransferase n=1 Tax=Microbacterium gorillae TaxID=1231063 RepID=UPI000694EBCF|nr:GNAT family N-acetyltransferase [Microbacterium gorillae]